MSGHKNSKNAQICVLSKSLFLQKSYWSEVSIMRVLSEYTIKSVCVKKNVLRIRSVSLNIPFTLQLHWTLCRVPVQKSYSFTTGRKLCEINFNTSQNYHFNASEIVPRSKVWHYLTCFGHTDLSQWPTSTLSTQILQYCFNL